MPRRTLTEARETTTATAVDGSPGRFLIDLITPGWGTSGYYSPQVLEAAAGDRVFPAGMHMYVDHPRGDGSGVDIHGNRSIQDLAAVLAEDARWEDGVLVAEATVFGPYRDVLTQMADSIGVSVRATADVAIGEAEGRRGTIVTELVEGRSADFVTRAGRGGRIAAVIESARPAQVVERAVLQGVTEATANELREWLQETLREAYGAERSWVWVRDFDDSHVWYEHETPDDCGTFQHAYTVDGSTVTLSGDPIEVRMETNYVPVNPAGQPTTESEEDTMPQIEEARLRQLEEAHGRVPTLESERDTAVTRAETAEGRADTAEARVAELEEAAAVRERTDRASAIITERATEAGVTFTALEARGLSADLPLTSEGALDEDAFATTVDEAAAEKATHSGAGRPRGVTGRKPGEAGDADVSESDVTDMIRRRAGLEQKGA